MTEEQQEDEPKLSRCGAVGDDVYIRSEEYGWVWVPAPVMSPSDQDDDMVQVSVQQYESEDYTRSDAGRSAVGFKSVQVKLEDYSSNTLPQANTGPDHALRVVDDLKDLPYIHEAAILYNLKSRHLNGLPYCRIGNLDMIVAMNPYQWLENLHHDQTKNQYANINGLRIYIMIKLKISTQRQSSGKN